MNNFWVTEYLVNFHKQFWKYVFGISCAAPHPGKQILTLDSMFLEKYFHQSLRFQKIKKKSVRTEIILKCEHVCCKT